MKSKIPTEMQEKYGAQDIDALMSMGYAEDEAAKIHYFSFLSNTDYISNKIVDELIDDLASATVLQFVTVFIDFIKKIKVEYNEELRYRKIAREEINKLQNETEADEE